MPIPPLPEDAPIDLNALVEPWIGAIVAGLGIAVVVQFALVIALGVRGRRMARRIDGLTRGSDGRSLEAILDAHLDRVFQVRRDVETLDARAAAVEAVGRRSLQRFGMVRFNPFEDTGGNQSFALALLDADGDGVVISSLHARAGTRVYAKPLARGRSAAALSAEETEAVRRAMAPPVGERAQALTG